MNRKSYSGVIAKQIFNGPVGTTNGPNYEAVIQGANLSVQLGNQEIKRAAKLRLVGYDEQGKEMESIELAQGSKLRLMVNAESISSVSVSNSKVFIENAQRVGKVKAASNSTVWVSNVASIGIISSESGSIVVEKCRKLGGAGSKKGEAVVRTRRDASPKRRQVLTNE